MHEAFETTTCSAGSYWSVLMPTQKVASTAPFAGALMITRLAPASRCPWHFSLLRKTPVHSSTISAPSSPHFSFEGSFSALVAMT